MLLSSPPNGVSDASVLGMNSGNALESIFSGDLASSSLKGWPPSDLMMYINLNHSQKDTKLNKNSTDTQRKNYMKITCGNILVRIIGQENNQQQLVGNDLRTL